MLRESARLLLIDTCGEAAGVALCAGNEVVAREEFGQGRASAEIVAAVRRMLTSVGWTLAELDGVGVVSGPGSFTGVRTGLAAAKGFCEVSGVPLAAVSRLEVLGGGLAVLDAGRGEVYVREMDGREWLCGMEELGIVAAGRGVVVAEERVAERLRESGFEVTQRRLRVEEALAAVRRCLGEGGSDVAAVDANYVRGEGDMYRAKAGGVGAG